MYQGVIISGFPLSGKSTLAKRLSEELGLEVFSVGELFREEWRDKYPNKEESFEEYWRGISFEENKKMEDKAREKLSSKAMIGEFRFAISCKGLDYLFVFCVADLDIRVKRALESDKYEGKSPEEVRQILLTRGQDELKTGKELYGEGYDYRDKKNYDLVLDMGKLTVEQGVDAIRRSLGR